MDALHLITVHETAETELIASGAQIVIEIAGQSFFTGDQAFEKAGEVSGCVQALKKCGLTQDQITLESVSTHIETGLLTKSSSAAYRLQVKVPEIDQLGCVLAAISSQKNARIVGTTWIYRELQHAKQETIQNAVRAARAVAQKISAALGASLTGVHKLSYQLSGLDTDSRVPSNVRIGGQRAAAASALESLELSHKTRLTAAVTAEFLIGELARE